MTPRATTDVIDVDRHVIEPVWLWREYLPAAYREFAPVWRVAETSDESLDARLARLGERALLPVPAVLSVAARPVWRGLSEVALIEMGIAAQARRAALHAAQTAEGHLAHMADAGVTLSLLLPTYASYLAYDDGISPELSRAYATAYNRWLAELCAVGSARLKGAVLLARASPETLVEDLQQGLDAGLIAAVIRPEPVHGRSLAAAAYEPLWAACASASIAVLIHGGTHARVATAGADRFETHFAQHMCSHPLEAMMALVALLEGGVFARHPNLRVGLLECGSGWLPSWLTRLDKLWDYCRAELRGRVDQPPSQTIAQQCFIAVEPGEPLLSVIEQVGAQSLVFGSDYPHLDHPTAIEREIEQLGASVGGAVSQQILGANARRLLGQRI